MRAPGAPEVIALDFDRTLVQGYAAGPRPSVNPAVIRGLQARGTRAISICTNQGGLTWWLAGAVRQDGSAYPSPGLFVARLSWAQMALYAHGIEIAHLRVACYHPSAPPALIERAAQQVRDFLRGAFADWRVYAAAAARKPGGLMLRSVGATEFWGDSKEDAGASASAGVPFVGFTEYN